MVEGRLIDWEKVPEERLEEVITLHYRLTAIEAGYIEGYGNNVAGLLNLSEAILSDAENRQEYISCWHDSLDYLAKMYSSVDFEEVPLTRDTAPYFVCKQLYERKLLPAAQEFSWELEQNQETEETAKKVQYWSKAICEIGRLVPLEVIYDLKKIPGCENREFKGIWVPHKLCTHPEYKLSE